MVNGERKASGSDLICEVCGEGFRSTAQLKVHFGHKHIDEALAAMDGTGTVKLSGEQFEFTGAHTMGLLTPLKRNIGLLVIPLMLGLVAASVVPVPLNYPAAALAGLTGLVIVCVMAMARETQQCLRIVERNGMVIWQFDWLDRREVFEWKDGALRSKLPEACWKEVGRKRLPVIDTTIPEHSLPFNAYSGESGITDTLVASKVEHSDSLAIQIRPFNLTSAAALRLGGMILITGIFAIVDYLLFQSIVDFNTAQQAIAAAR